MNLSNTIKQRVRYVDYKQKSALVLNKKGKSYPVNLSDKVIADGIQEKDLAFIRIINGIWIIVDFERRTITPADDFDAESEGLMGEY
jgi:hypothetical protein